MDDNYVVQGTVSRAIVNQVPNIKTLTTSTLCNRLKKILHIITSYHKKK